MQFLVAGNETTTNALASGLLILGRRPDLLRRLRAEPSLIPAFVEEVLRLETPVQGLFRLATCPAGVAGRQVPSDAALWALYGAANRDGSVFPDPDEVRLDRTNGRSHLAFGHGIHYCVGATLARAELRIGFERLLARLVDLTVVSDNPEYAPSYILHGPRQVQLTFRKADG
jgi:cytochrome P450